MTGPCLRQHLPTRSAIQAAGRPASRKGGDAAEQRVGETGAMLWTRVAFGCALL